MLGDYYMGLKEKLIVAGVGVGLLGLVAYPVIPHLDRETYRGEITVAERIQDHGYRISIDQGQGNVRTFQNTDSFLELKFNSADVQGAAHVGKTCSIDTYGYRLPLFSWFENVTDVYNCD